jgi:hypothetical protein
MSVLLHVKAREVGIQRGCGRQIGTAPLDLPSSKAASPVATPESICPGKQWQVIVIARTAATRYFPFHRKVSCEGD